MARAVAEEYARAVLRHADSQKPPAKRRRSGEDPFLHFDWLVLHQVQRWTCERITEEYGGENQSLDPSAVDKAIRAAAELVGLPIAPLPKGRKRKA